ncbi:hypothetical protein IWW37_001792 [Coemansia sp. RSA 2050]|nr:hypothetical protein IWW37_001792 [Coemansia sp. RSA 2050]
MGAAVDVAVGTAAWAAVAEVAEGPGGVDARRVVQAAQSQAAAALRQVQWELVASSAWAGEIQAVVEVASVPAEHALAETVAVVLREQCQVEVEVVAAGVGRPYAVEVEVARRSFVESS